MPEKDKPAPDELLDALDSLTGLIAQREPHGPFSAGPEDELDLDGFDFGAGDRPLLPLQDTGKSDEPVLPSPGEIEALVDHLLDRRLAELRESLKRELYLELLKRYPDR